MFLETYTTNSILYEPAIHFDWEEVPNPRSELSWGTLRRAVECQFDALNNDISWITNWWEPSDSHISLYKKEKETDEQRMFYYLMCRCISKSECHKFLEAKVATDDELSLIIILKEFISNMYNMDKFVFVTVSVVGDELWCKVPIWDEDRNKFVYEDHDINLIDCDIDEVCNLIIQKLGVVKLALIHAVLVYQFNHFRIRVRGDRVQILPEPFKEIDLVVEETTIDTVARAPPAKYKIGVQNGYVKLSA